MIADCGMDINYDQIGWHDIWTIAIEIRINRVE